MGRHRHIRSESPLDDRRGKLKHSSECAGEPTARERGEYTRQTEVCKVTLTPGLGGKMRLPTLIKRGGELRHDFSPEP